MCSYRIVAIGKILAERCFQFHFHYSDIRKHLHAPIRAFATMQQHLLFYRTVFRSQPPILRENCQSASRGWVQLLRLRASLRRDGDGLCENSINECSKSSECRDSIPTKGGCDWWREYAIEVDFGLKIGCRLRFIRVHDFRRKSRIDGLCLVLPLSVFRTKEEIL